MNYHLVVAREQSGMELDEFLCREFPLLSKRYLRASVRSGMVLINGQEASPSHRLRIDEVVSVEVDEDQAEAERAAPEGVALPVLFEDAHVLAVDKPADLAVEPDRWDALKPSLIGALQALAGERAQAAPAAGFRPRLVHRLDKDTSGCVLVAKTIEAERELREAFDGGRVRKRYAALVEGEHPVADGESTLIDLPLGPDPRRSGTSVVRDDGKPAQTRVSVEQRFRGYTLLACEPLTGRTHQLRVHLAATGFPLVVDPLYGRRDALLLSEFKSGYRPKPGRAEPPLIARLSLHAREIEFPAVGDPARRVQVRSPLPRDFERVLKQLAKVRPPRNHPR